MRLSILLVVILALNSCITGEKTEVVVEKGDTVRGELSLDSKIFLGNRLFSEKTCITCHDIDKNKIGPSVIDIMNIYKDKNELLCAIAEEGFRLQRERVGRFNPDNSADNAAEQFELLMQHYIEFAIEHPAHYELMYGGNIWKHKRATPSLTSSGCSAPSPPSSPSPSPSAPSSSSRSSAGCRKTRCAP